MALNAPVSEDDEEDAVHTELEHTLLPLSPALPDVTQSILSATVLSSDSCRAALAVVVCGIGTALMSWLRDLASGILLFKSCNPIGRCLRYVMPNYKTYNG